MHDVIPRVFTFVSSTEVVSVVVDVVVAVVVDVVVAVVVRQSLRTSMAHRKAQHSVMAPQQLRWVVAAIYVGRL